MPKGAGASGVKMSAGADLATIRFTAYRSGFPDLREE
jgi:hypothetical protein